MAVIIWASFLWARPAENFVGESSRIVFYHVPMAWVATVAFFLAAWHSAVYLRRRRAESDEAAAAAARLGLVFCVLATVTGAIFARVMWNAYWNWDPRQTSITLLLLVYGAYLGLRGAIEDSERAHLSAAYALVASSRCRSDVRVPRMYASLHRTPSSTPGEGRDVARRQTVFFASNLAFLVLFFWLYSLDRKVSRLLREARP
jgi:heme exporter protein C